MILRQILTLALSLASLLLIAQNGFEIKVKIKDYPSSKLTLGYHYGDKQYIKDTVQVNSNQEFIFRGEEPLQEGIYLLVMEPDNNFIQLLVDDGNQEFTFETQVNDLVKGAKVEGSSLNKDYFTYLKYLDSKLPEKNGLNEKLGQAETNSQEFKDIKAKIQAIDSEVKKYHIDLAKRQGKSLLGRIVASRLDPEIPEFTGDDVDMKRYRFYKKHYFDNAKLDDEGLLRSPVLYQKAKYYINQLTPQTPDSINASLDYILQNSKGSENFKFFLIHYLNEYAKSNIVGMDAVYVHLVEKYYAKGHADWTDEEQLNKIVENAKTLKPILIGNTAPNLVFKKQNQQKLSIHDVDSDYTVLFFWDPDCGHCKKSMPDVIAFHEKFNTKGVEILAVCTKVGEDDEMKKCWETIEEKKMGNWINVTDQWLQSNYKKVYDIKSTPRIFILDKEKKIVMKGIGAEQLIDVMDQIIQEETQ